MNKTYYNEFFEYGQQEIKFNLYEIGLPSDDAVYTLKKVMEELNYTKLLGECKEKGRKGYNPIMLFALITYANMRGVKAVDKIVELCERDIAFMWLSNGLKPQRDVFYEFIKHKLTQEVQEDLHYQFIRRLQKEGYVTLSSLFVDGTKIEANANRYTFVWRGSINYHLVGLIEKIEKLYIRYNAFLQENDYAKKYEIEFAQMFVVEGIERIKSVLEKNKKRKANEQKKLSNNQIIEIDNCSPIEMLQMQVDLIKVANGEKLAFVEGKGHKKPEIQMIYEEIVELSARLLKYKEHYEILGVDRNSYSKTDIEATFMRMKDDHMQNGQLKPAYNVQIAVENYFIIHTYISSDRTDYNTLIPVIEKHKSVFTESLKSLTADSGYCSERNLLYLQQNNIASYIKLQTHEKMKTRAYQQDIGKHYNMQCIVEGDAHHYLCHDGRKLEYIRTEHSQQDGYTREIEVYGCNDCSLCEHKARCLYKYNEERDKDKNKVMKINETWEDLKAESHANIQSEQGIENRHIRSIQTEGHFGDIKENENQRRFNFRSTEKVRREFMIHVFARNMNKYHRFEQGKLKKYSLNTEQTPA